MLPAARLCALALLSTLVACAVIPDQDPVRVSTWTKHEYLMPNRQRIPVVYPPGAPPILSDYASSTNMVGTVRYHIHNGIDLGHFGDGLLAMADGVVTRASWSEWGNTVTIQHGVDDDGLRTNTSYGHLHEMLVRKGDQVKRGQLIGIVGGTGKAAGPISHVHVNTYKFTPDNIVVSVNPHRYWLDGPGLVTCFDPADSRQVSDKAHKPGEPIRYTYPIRCAK